MVSELVATKHTFNKANLNECFLLSKRPESV
jgi:hypothetical protein